MVTPGPPIRAPDASTPPISSERQLQARVEGLESRLEGVASEIAHFKEQKLGIHSEYPTNFDRNDLRHKNPIDEQNMRRIHGCGLSRVTGLSMIEPHADLTGFYRFAKILDPPPP